MPEDAHRRCQLCGVGLLAGQRKFCCPIHRARALRSSRPDRGPLAAFLWDRITADQLTQAQLERKLEVSRGTVGNLLQGRRPTARTYGRLKAWFGEELPVIETESDRRSELMRGPQGALARAASRTPEARRRAGEAMRGRKFPARSAAMKALIAQRKDQGQEWHRPVDLGALSKTVPARATNSLRQRLRLCPTPDGATLQLWACDVGKRLGLRADVVMKIWQPLLRDRGIVKVGRPRMDRRAHDVVAPMVATRRPGPGRNLPRGFWAEAATAVNAAERPSSSAELGRWRPITDLALKRWWRDHETTCTTCLTAKVTPQQAVNQPSA